MEKILEQYGRVTVYMESNHPSPMYHVDGGVEPNPYGNLAVLLEDDNLEEVMYNGGAQCVKVAHRDHGMCRTNVWVDDHQGLEIAKILQHLLQCLLEMVLEWFRFSTVDYLMEAV